MADIFVSYARKDKARVAPLVAGLTSHGWSVWWDPDIAGGQEFDELITTALAEARAVVVVWTSASVTSRWVRGEARIAADKNVLVPVQFGTPDLPIDARAIHTIDFSEWNSKTADGVFQELVRSLSGLLGRPQSDRKADRAGPAISICVLPFVNISGDVEQEYFSDGISEDIITDLSKVSSLAVVARNTAFTFKGKPVDVGQMARQLNVSHVLEGSVRKSGNRVRISAQLIDGETGNHIWAERYDRDLTDIFALQDEISEAIVGALQLKLLPEEKTAIESRGTTNAEAYKLFLMARRFRTGNVSERNSKLVTRLYLKAVQLDPNYAIAWALLSITQSYARFFHSDFRSVAVPAAERALELDPNLSEAHAAKSRILAQGERHDEALAEAELAIRLDPNSYDANAQMANVLNALRRYAEAAPYYERAHELNEMDFSCLGMALCCYEALGDSKAVQLAARRSIARLEKVIAGEPDNGSAISFGVNALSAIGEVERAKEWTERALLFDPDNTHMQYNIACSFSKAHEIEAALDILEPLLESAEFDALAWTKADADLDPIRDHPRYKAMVAKAEARIASQRLGDDAATEAG